jgi:hypothetical protein
MNMQRSGMQTNALHVLGTLSGMCACRVQLFSNEKYFNIGRKEKQVEFLIFLAALLHRIL